MVRQILPRYSRLGLPTTLACHYCRFQIPFVLKLGRFDLGCPECPGKTPVEVAIKNTSVTVTLLVDL